MRGGLRRRKWLQAWAWFTLVAYTAQSWGVQATLVGDAHVSSAQPSVNAGGLSNLNVGGGYTALVQFDLSAAGVLPVGTTAAQITRATLRLFCNRADTPGLVSVQAANGAWSESAVTYSSMPALGAVVQTVQVSGAGEFVTFDVTQLVQAWVSGASVNNGFALTSANAVVQFDSKENDQTAHAPELEIALAAGGAGVAGPAGATGATGATGPAGPQGPQGVPGLQGPQGLTGATGAVGATGALGPVGPAGQQGAQGPQGIAGQAGAQGIPGATGATGLQGPMGPQGVAGPVGLSFQGTYSSTTNYALGDGVLWQGAGWVSLMASNHGHTPDQSPSAWQMFAAPGVAGATGATGATGAAGVNGVQGPAGATGAMGATGATGPAGVPGLVYQGAYDSVQSYALGDVVVWQGSSYASLQASNHGQTPGLSPAWWGILSSQGAMGAVGPMGATGPAGPIGPQGIQGAQGVQGVQGAAGPQGPAGAQGLTGATGAQGPQGATGSQGPAGQAGAQGIPGTIGATGPQGPAGVAGATGATGPSGATGPAGAVGMNFRGPWSNAIHYSVNDAVTYAGSTYLAQIGGTNFEPDAYSQVWIVIAAAGGAGPTGAAGTPATVSVGAVTTLAAGSSATVTNTGTAQAAVLNFGIPQGVQGAAGSGGSSSGTSSGNFAAVFHAVSYATTYYAVNSPNANTNEVGTTSTTGVLAWVPNGCTASQLSVYSQQSNTIKVTLRVGTPGSMSNTTLACSPGTNASCTATGSVAVVAGDFIDYEIDSASGTPAGVWTALTCQ